jgi:antitoxin component HigA of HigAB toxin-antitoxin module
MNEPKTKNMTIKENHEMKTETPKTSNMYHIKPFLKKRGYNLSYLANSLGMSFQRFSHHIKPKDDLSYNLILGLSEQLQITPEEFVENVKINDHVA